jgi:hypothetical protein
MLLAMLADTLLASGRGYLRVVDETPERSQRGFRI